MGHSMNVAFIIFNRPDTTERVFTEIARAKPHKLFVIADGPRPDWPGEAEKCAAVRTIIDRVDWDCQVLKDFSDVNLGCGPRVSTGLSWVFEQVEEAIILEDDCLPHPSFFPFCQELLAKYRDDEQIMMITGNQFSSELHQSPYSFYFSRWAHIWGWASWSRAWQYQDMAMKRWPAFRARRWLEDILRNPMAVEYIRKVFDKTAAGEIDTWDYQWLFACWMHHGLTIHPNVNLVSNLGCRADATHTKNSTDIRANLPLEPMRFPLRYPPRMACDHQTEQFFIDNYLMPPPPTQPGFCRRLYSQCVSVLPSPIRKGLSFLKRNLLRVYTRTLALSVQVLFAQEHSQLVAWMLG